MDVDLVVERVPCPDGWRIVWQLAFDLLQDAAENAGSDVTGSSPGGATSGDARFIDSGATSKNALSCKHSPQPGTTSRRVSPATVHDMQNPQACA